MNFTKMHGIGNDYIYINCFQEKIENPSELSIRLSHRRFGIGSDGIILIKPSEKADCEMDIYNADGSRAMMCGNGIRCVGKYVYDNGICKKDVLKIDTQSGIKTLYLTVENDKVKSVKVNMGSPILEPQLIPTTFTGETAVDVPLNIDGKEYKVTCVSMGNPHCVTFVADTKSIEIEKIGPKFENNSVFPQRVNTEFIQVLSRKEVNMRVWERGSGETWACGTGACASAVACILNGLTDESIVLHLKGGDLHVTWDRAYNIVWMEGTATTVFEGTVDI